MTSSSHTSDPVTESESPVCVSCPFISCTGPVPGQHLPTPPAGKPHEILLLTTFRQPAMGEGVTEHVRVQVFDAGLCCPPSKHLGDAVARHDTSSTDPQLRPGSLRVLAALPQVPLESLTCLVTERTRSRAASLAHDDRNIRIKVKISDRKTSDLGQAHPGVQEEPDEGCVPTILEGAATHHAQQTGDHRLIQYRYGFLRHGGGAQPCER